MSSTSMPATAPRGLTVDRPLVALDLETTGLDIEHDRIVEISCVKLGPSGDHDQVLTLRLNPQTAISAEAQAVHGIDAAQVANAPTFADVRGQLLDFLHGCDLTGFNLQTFDLPLLAKEFERVGVMFPPAGTRVIDSRRIFLAKEPRSLRAAYRLYCGADLENAHSAEADAKAAAAILKAQLERYQDLPRDVEELHAFCHQYGPGRPKGSSSSG